MPKAPKGKGKSRSKSPSVSPDGTQKPKIPRPMNPWLVFRREMGKKLAPAGGSRGQGSISKEIGAKWRTMTAEEKQIYVDRAEVCKQEHKLKYPNYKYQPQQRPKQTTSAEQAPPAQDREEQVQQQQQQPQPEAQDESAATPPPPTPPMSLLPLDTPLPSPPSIAWASLLPAPQHVVPLGFHHSQQAYLQPTPQLHLHFNGMDSSLTDPSFFAMPPPVAIAPMPPIPVHVEVQYGTPSAQQQSTTGPTSLYSTTTSAFIEPMSDYSTSLVPSMQSGLIDFQPYPCGLPNLDDFSVAQANPQISSTFQSSSDPFFTPTNDFSSSIIDDNALIFSDSPGDGYNAMPSTSTYLPPSGASNALRRVGGNWRGMIVGAQ